MTPSPSLESDQLEPGSELAVGPYRLRCIEVLGSGSYSVVWRAKVAGSLVAADGRHVDKGEVALKDVHCRNHAALRQSLFEVQLLLALEREALLRPDAGELRIPRCFSYTVDSHVDGWRVRTAMSCLPGEQLELWLHGMSDAACARAASVPWTSHLRQGCAMADLLIRQLGPTLELLAPLAWHRDVNSHNVLVSDAPGHLGAEEADSAASFWLCDLGLAVASESWVSDPAPPGASGAEQGAWRVTDIGGDCRYWPASSWMVHCYGADYLASRQDFCRQYQTRLDVHGLGITAIEVICSVALAARGAGAAAGADGPGGEECWSWLLSSWEQFHRAVSHWWDTIYQVFSGGGDFRPVHDWLVQQAVSEQVVDLMADLRAALRSCAAGCAMREPAVACLLRVVAELTDECSRLELGEACSMLGAFEPRQPRRQPPQAPVEAPAPSPHGGGPSSPCSGPRSAPGSPPLAAAGAPPPAAEPREAEAPHEAAAPPAAHRNAVPAPGGAQRRVGLAAAVAQECQSVLDSMVTLPAGVVGIQADAAQLESARGELLTDLERLRLTKLSVERALLTLR